MENEEIDSVSLDAMLSVAEGVPSYDRYTEASYSNIRFHGKSIEEWIEEVKLPDFFEDMNFQEIEEFNSRYLKVIETVMRNHSIARTGMNYAKMHYQKSFLTTKKSIIDGYIASGRKAPAAHVIEDNANIMIIDIYTAYQISVMFFEFWESQAEKIKLAGFRLNSLNHIKKQ